MESILPHIIRRKFVTKCQAILPNTRDNRVKRFLHIESTSLTADAIAKALHPELVSAQFDLRPIHSERFEMAFAIVSFNLNNSTEDNDTNSLVMLELQTQLHTVNRSSYMCTRSNSQPAEVVLYNYGRDT